VNDEIREDAARLLDLGRILDRLINSCTDRSYRRETGTTILVRHVLNGEVAVKTYDVKVYPGPNVDVIP
jgi:hypothetical protein